MVVLLLFRMLVSRRLSSNLPHIVINRVVYYYVLGEGRSLIITFHVFLNSLNTTEFQVLHLLFYNNAEYQKLFFSKFFRNSAFRKLPTSVSDFRHQRPMQRSSIPEYLDDPDPSLLDPRWNENNFDFLSRLIMSIEVSNNHRM